MNLSVVRKGDGPRDGQPQPMAGHLPGARRVRPVKAVEDAQQVRFFDAGAVVADRNEEALRQAAAGNFDAAARGRIFQRVVHENADRLLDHGAVAQQGAFGQRPADDAMVDGDDFRLLDKLPEHLRAVEGGKGKGERLFVMPRQEQKVFDQLLHALRLAGNGGDGFVANVRVVLAPALEQARVSLQDRNGRAQLMRGVGHELLLPVIGGLNAVEHVVDDHGQIAQLVLRARHVDARGKVFLAHLLGGLGNVRNGLQQLGVEAVTMNQERYRTQQHQPRQPEEQAAQDERVLAKRKEQLHGVHAVVLRILQKNLQRLLLHIDAPALVEYPSSGLHAGRQQEDFHALCLPVGQGGQRLVPQGDIGACPQAPVQHRQQQHHGHEHAPEQKRVSRRCAQPYRQADIALQARGIAVHAVAGAVEQVLVRLRCRMIRLPCRFRRPARLLGPSRLFRLSGFLPHSPVAPGLCRRAALHSVFAIFFLHAGTCSPRRGWYGWS